MIPFLILIVWVVVGASVGFYEVRRGHWRWLWLVGAMVGPLAIPLARLANEQEPFIKGEVLEPSSRRGHPGLHVLVGVDGSAESLAAARGAAELFGSRLGELTLATVVDYEMASTTSAGTGGSEAARVERAAAEERLREAAESLGAWLGWKPGTVLLAGRPAEALRAHAADDGTDVMVVGRRGRGLTKQLLGSCADDLTRSAPVPVLLLADDGSRTSGAHAGERAATRS